jgi:chromate transporter
MIEKPTVSQTTRVWAKIGLLSFGGPAAQIALMHKEIVENHKWLSENQFLNALNFCMLLPGPEAMQLATYAGWRINGTIGGLIAGLLFFVPGAIVIAILATIYAYFGSQPWVAGVFLGIKATVVIIVIEALLRVSKKALVSRIHYFIATSAFVGIFFLNLPYPLIVILAAIVGLTAKQQSLVQIPVQLDHPVWSTLKTLIIWLSVWWLPVMFVSFVFDLQFLTQIAMFFSKLAVVTFGGAYAVLAYMAQDVVTAKEWLTAGQMMDGLGLAETTPGPLILVTEFVAFLAGFSNGGIGTALSAALMALWVTFTPCFLWVFLGAPYIDWIGNQPKLRAALSGVTSAVVGVIFNLSLWFAIHVFFDDVTQFKLGLISFPWPNFTNINLVVLLLAVLSYIMLIKRHWNIVWVLTTSASLALGFQLV